MEQEIGREVVCILLTKKGSWREIKFSEYALIKSKMSDAQRKEHEDNQLKGVMPSVDGPMFLFIKEL